MSKRSKTLLKNLGIEHCVKCQRNFEPGDVVATSTTLHYCYQCGIKVNLVSGNLKNDLHLEDFTSEISLHIKNISNKNNISDSIEDFAQVLINTAFANSYHVSKNKLGLALAALSLSFRIKENSKMELKENLSISKKTLEANQHLLEKSLEKTYISSISQELNRMIR